ncbi:Muskelin [Termitomyces sp. T112]|nr:Muskelin [Termitomyces sp. T112]
MPKNVDQPTESILPLEYSIVGSSAHSGRYVAENILVDRSTDQSSRWSGSSQNNQWITLRLENLAVLKTITFGKFFKPHPCNMKDFKIYVGLGEDRMNEVLHTSLKNDTTPETFDIKYFNNAGIRFPTRYVKIVPISAHGQSFHTSIWHVSLTGITDEAYVERVRLKYDEFQETTVLRHVLKYLRQRRLLTPYESIISRSGIQPEHPLITKLYESVVLRGDWKQAEDTLSLMSKTNLFDSYIHGTQPYAVWRRLYGTNADGDVPSPRGGHAMCMDPINDMIYLFGGWDGKKSLDDFWVYSVREDKWQILSHGTSEEKNAPGARSCHKMVFDTKTGNIYVLGRLSDSDSASAIGDPATPMPQANNGDSSSTPTRVCCSEFYRYHTRGIDSGKWDFLSFDTASQGGPPLIFDHQMVLDSEAQIIYVFGGRVVDREWDTVKYSGLYSYNIRLSKWKLLQIADPPVVSPSMIPSRSGHSMVLEPLTRTLYIFAGQRDDRYLCDMFAYDIATNTATELFSNFSAVGGPNSSFTQRAVIDPSLRELYVFCGLTRNQQADGVATTLASEAPNWMYSYDSAPGTWTQILSQPLPPHGMSSNSSDDMHSEMYIEQPQPRYAHQVVYNPLKRTVFLHGGNVGVKDTIEHAWDGHQEERVDDLWQMTLFRAGAEEVIRRATYQLRQQQFREMCEDTTPIEALNFLQTDVSAVVDHTNAKETGTFRSLLAYLLSPSAPTPSPKPHTVDEGSKSEVKIDNEDKSPPRKHSCSLESDQDTWTNKLDEDNEPPEMPGTLNVQALLEAEDPRETELSLSSGTASAGKAAKLTAGRFKQRNEVFESLLEFVAEGAKQPSGNLSDIICVDKFDGQM